MTHWRSPARVRALDGFSVTMTQGRSYSLIGPNGSGKTTFIKCLLRTVIPDKLSVFDIEVVVAHLLLVPAPDSTAARVSSNTKTPYKWDASSG